MATILVVDDRSINRQFLATLLEYANHRIVQAGSGEEALAMVRRERPQLIMVDIITSTDGFEFMSALRQDPAIGGTPVIFYTAIDRETEAKNVAKRCGVQHVLTKPADPELILNVVAKVIGETTPEREKERLYRAQSHGAKPDLERQVLQSQKMEAMGQLAGGMAHDFNNLLMALSTYSELLQLQLPQENPASKIATEIRKITDQGTNLTRQLLAFSRRQVLSPKILDLNHTITNIREMLCTLIGDGIRLKMKLSKLATIQADPGQVEQVLVNIGVNARDAMPEGGTLTIETENLDIGQHCKTSQLDLVPGRYVKLRIGDTGVGMDEQTLSRIFEPFFTTKEEGKGTGLGLSTVYGIVQQSGGQISVVSAPGMGTTFDIYFPQVEAEAAPSNAPVAERSNLNGHGEIILLVDSNDAIRTAVRDLLRIKGYNVLQASNGTEALNVAMNQTDKIDILISDIVMPSPSGDDLSAQLRKTYPHLKTLYMSGHSERALQEQDDFDSDAVFVFKPVSMQTLLFTIREMLNKPR